MNEDRDVDQGNKYNFQKPDTLDLRKETITQAC